MPASLLRATPGDVMLVAATGARLWKPVPSLDADLDGPHAAVRIGEAPAGTPVLVVSTTFPMGWDPCCLVMAGETVGYVEDWALAPPGDDT